MTNVSRFYTVPANDVMLTHASGHWTTREVGEFVSAYRRNIDRLRSITWADLIVLHQYLEIAEGVTQLLKPEIVRARQGGLRAVALVNLSENPLINVQSYLVRIYLELGVNASLFNALEPACKWLETYGFVYKPESQPDNLIPPRQTELMDKKQPAL